MQTNLDFQSKAAIQWEARRFLCVGLDSELHRVATTLANGINAGYAEPQLAFNRTIVDATCDIAGAYKPNAAFYEARGAQGMEELAATIRYINEVAPAVPVILDAKRADIGSTNEGYVEFAFEYLRADALTVHPYLGHEAMLPLLSQRTKGIFVLARTSNPGAGEFQDRLVSHDAKGPTPLYLAIAEAVAQAWNVYRNCGLVVGATYPDEIRSIRAAVPDLPFLIPGVGTQGGDLEASVRYGMTAEGSGVFINVSRGIIFASSDDQFGENARSEAIRLHDSILRALDSR